MNEQWIQQMRQKMADYKWPAPEVSWDEIDRVLAANRSSQARLLWLRRMAAAAVFLLIAGVGYWSLLHNDTERAAEKRTTQVQPTVENYGDENHGDWHNDSSIAKIRVPVPVILSPDTVHTVATAEMEQTRVAEEKIAEEKVAEEKVKPADHTHSVIYPAALHQRKHIGNRLTAKVYMSSTMTDSQTETFSIHGGPIGGGPTIAGPNDSVYVHTTQRYRQPVRLGFLLRYRLNGRWSVESGLSYTHLSSDITTTMNGMTTVTEQHLNYIGLPLNISYDLWKSRHFGLYISTGGMIEKRLDASPWQFSINGSAGAEYKLTDIFSLYAEPGLGYYLKDGSTTPTIYQDRPLNFNLSFGLRFDLK